MTGGVAVGLKGYLGALEALLGVADSQMMIWGNDSGVWEVGVAAAVACDRLACWHGVVRIARDWPRRIDDDRAMGRDKRMCAKAMWAMRQGVGHWQGGAEGWQPEIDSSWMDDDADYRSQAATLLWPKWLDERCEIVVAEATQHMNAAQQVLGPKAQRFIYVRYVAEVKRLWRLREWWCAEPVDASPA
jgi:hypothetical protein